MPRTMSRGSQVLVDCGPGQEDQLCVVSSVVYSPGAPRKGVAGDHLWLILLDAKSGKFLPHPVRCSHVKPPARDQFLRKLPPAFADADQRLFGDISATDAIPIMPPEFPGSVVGKTMLSTCTAKDSGQKGPENDLTDSHLMIIVPFDSLTSPRETNPREATKATAPGGEERQDQKGAICGTPLYHFPPRWRPWLCRHQPWSSRRPRRPRSFTGHPPRRRRRRDSRYAHRLIIRFYVRSKHSKCVDNRVL